MEGSVLLDILRDVALPALTAVAGWFASIWRTKQKKEKDVLENVTQILDMQKKYIADQDEENRKTREYNKHLEEKLNGKNRAIRAANWCKYTNEGEGCPVLVSDAKRDTDKCETCRYNKEEGEYNKEEKDAEASD